MRGVFSVAVMVERSESERERVRVREGWVDGQIPGEIE